MLETIRCPRCRSDQIAVTVSKTLGHGKNIDSAYCHACSYTGLATTLFRNGEWQQQTEEALREALRKILLDYGELDAIFWRRIPGGFCHVYLVVEEHTDSAYEILSQVEPLLDDKFDSVFCQVRAHQGREDWSTCVPGDAERVEAV